MFFTENYKYDVFIPNSKLFEAEVSAKDAVWVSDSINVQANRKLLFISSINISIVSIVSIERAKSAENSKEIKIVTNGNHFENHYYRNKFWIAQHFLRREVRDMCYNLV